MVAVIHSGSSLRTALNYNEQKVKQKVATCLAAVNYPKDVEQLTFNQKLSRLQKQADLNIKTRTNSVHISLNFDPSEKFSHEKLKEISDVYINKIGFAGQPYLLYQHHDAGHPHVHILTTNIRPDGKRIELHNLGRIQSENARKEIEKSFGLVKAEDSKQRQAYQLNPINIQAVKYGHSESKRAISNVLDRVMKNYKFTTLPELNAVLQLYNVKADQGSENSRIFKNKGLTYRIIDEQGNKIGVPIKASDFYNKPTLRFLEGKFLDNEQQRNQHKSKLKNAIDLILLKHPAESIDHLIKALEKQGIDTVLRQNEKGIIYGITYVDHRTQCVFNGSALGKSYSAKGILERSGISQFMRAQNKEHVGPFQPQTALLSRHPELVSKEPNKENTGVLEILMTPEYSAAYVPHHLSGKTKKKRKKRISKHL